MHPIEHLRYVARAHGADATSLVRESAMALGSLRADHRNLVVACRRIVERHPAVGPLWWMSARLLMADDPSDLAWDLADEINDDRTPRAVARELAGEATVVTIGWPETAGDGLMRRADVRVLCADANHEASSFMQRLERCDVDCEPISPEWLARATAAADVVMVDALAASAQRVITPIGSHVLAAVARATDTPVWLVAGIGRRLPNEYVDEIAARVLPPTDGDDHDDDIDADFADRFDSEVEELPLDLVTHVATRSGVADVDPSAFAPDAPFAPELLRTSAM